jgi:hypothetical protein
MVALAMRFRMRLAMESLDRLSNTRCSHARSTNILNDYCHAQCLQASSTTTAGVDAQEHRSHPENFPYFTTPNTVRHRSPTSHILWLVVQLQRLHTRGHNPCQFPISKVCSRDALSICALAVHLYLHNHEWTPVEAGGQFVFVQSISHWLGRPACRNHTD